VPQAGYLTFYTHYLSPQGSPLGEHPRAAVVMHWTLLHRQVRVEGPVVKGPEADKDAYFASRLAEAASCLASSQSEPIASATELH